MARKKTINLAIPEALLAEFNEVCRHYGHAKQKGMVLSAAMLMFLEADPARQGEVLERILIADVRSGVESMVERARVEQARAIAQRDAESAAGAAPAAPPLRRAAKPAGRSRHGLPRREGAGDADPAGDTST
ncbi:MAG: hypothetical protein WD009_01140 [Phycisphaeraceae bacterium]